MFCSSVTFTAMCDHCERSRHNWICWNKNNPIRITATPAATAPVVRSRPEEYFATNCSMSVGFGGRNSNAGFRSRPNNSPPG